MIKKPTTLVLGAGASGPHFPTGWKLKSEILSKLTNQDGPFHECLTSCGYHRSQISEFVRTFRLSSQPSIDRFLEHRPDFQQIGKMIIAYSLISFEVEDLLTDDSPHWYPYLWSKLSTDPGSFKENNLSIITFNYDRSLEHFLYSAIQNSFNLPVRQCSELMKTIDIVHVHGQLCELPYLGGPGPYREYAPNLSPEHVKNAAESIRIVHEGDRMAGFARARGMLLNSEKVYFLGFGYHEANVNRLEMKDLMTHKPHIECAGSGYGLEPMECQTIRTDLFGTRISIADGLDALTFLRRFVSVS